MNDTVVDDHFESCGLRSWLRAGAGTRQRRCLVVGAHPIYTVSVAFGEGTMAPVHTTTLCTDDQ
jgi:hypothetical protein